MKLMKKMSILLTIFICACVLGSCKFNEYEIVYDNRFYYGYNDLFAKAFCCGYQWDYSQNGKIITIPEKYNKITIKELGGTNNDVEHGFYVRLYVSPNNRKSVTLQDISLLEYYEENYTVSNDVVYTFTLKIGKNIEAINSFFNPLYVGYDNSCVDLYRVQYIVECDEENKVFYSNDGKLYYKDSNLLVDSISYA